MFTTGFGHRGGEFGVCQTDHSHDHAAGGHREHGTQRAGGADPVPGEHHPAETDHGSETQGQHIPIAEHLQ